MKCPNCETENRESAKFCDECGFPLLGLELDFEAEPLPEPDDGKAEVEAEQAEEEKPEPESAKEEIADTQELYTPPEDDQDSLDAPVPEKPVRIENEAPGIDFTGLEVSSEDYGERLVDPSYEAPKPNWRDGNTIQMAPIDASEKEESKDYLASSTKKKKAGPKTIALIIAGVIVVVAAVALITFQMHLWGGKAVPDVRGMTEADATSVLEGDGFSVSVKQVKSDDTEGLVLITDPEPGNRVPDGSEVNVHIASARVIPEKIVGMSEADAKAALAEEGFENVKFEKESSEVPQGKVLSVSPGPGTRAKSAAEIVVKVSAPYVVPDVSSMYLDDAIEALLSAGLGYDVVYIMSDEYADGTMLGTSPAAGTEVKKGEVVNIQIAQARGTYLENLARQSLAPGTTITVNGTSYVIDSVSSVSYTGNGAVSYTATARAFTSLAGETVYGSPTTISNVITFSEDTQPIG